MNQFEIQPSSRFGGSSAAIRRPKEIACFSYDDKHQFHLDESSLRYYYPPRIPADLSKGFDKFEQLDDTADDHLDSLLRTIMALEEKTGVKVDAQIITWRGMMTKILAAPFDNFNEFEMNVVTFQDTIFIEGNRNHKLIHRMTQHGQPTPYGAASQDLMSYWGYKFETLSLLPEPWAATSREFIEGREDLVVNNYAQYCSVVKTGIGKTKLILGGEIDAVWDCKPQNNDAINWVELKTSAEIESDRDMLKYERKLLKFWAQSFLLGVPKIIVGFRNKVGVLQRIEELETKSIPGLVKRSGKGSWDGNTCINFAAAFLDWLKLNIKGDGVWRIRRREKSSIIEVYKLEETGYGDVLSPEFIQWRTRKMETRYSTEETTIP